MLHNEPLSAHCYYFLNSVSVCVCVHLELWGTWKHWWNAVGETPGWAVKHVPKQGNGECSRLISHFSQTRWSEVLRWWILPLMITDCNTLLPPILEWQREVSLPPGFNPPGVHFVCNPLVRMLCERKVAPPDKLFWLKLQSVSKVYRKGIWIELEKDCVLFFFLSSLPLQTATEYSVQWA